MSSKKRIFLFVQLIAIAVINWLILVQEGFIFRSHWPFTLCFSLFYFHAGSLLTFYVGLQSKIFSKEKANLLGSLNGFILTSFLFLLCFHNCYVKNENTLFYYFLGVFMIFVSILFLFDSRKAYLKYRGGRD